MIKPNPFPDPATKSATSSSHVVYEIGLWQRRFNGLEAMLDKVDNVLKQEFLGVEALRCVIKGFTNFARGQYAYFQDNDPPEDYQHEIALRITLNKLSEDLEVIERIASQRATRAQKDHIHQRLALTDFLAYEAMRPALDGLLPQETTVLTYFQKSPEIRVVPYANVALIGMPYSCLTADRDLLALPHEVGHYIYWNALSEKQPDGQFSDSAPRVADLLRWKLRKTNPFLADYALAWTEEAFADCYGAWLAGAYLAKDSQDYEVEYAPTALLRDDGDHPLPAIRPNSHIQMLRNQTKHDWADQLQTEWHTATQAEFNCDPDTTQFTPHGSNQLVMLKEAREDHLLKMAAGVQDWLSQIAPSPGTPLSFWQKIAPPPFATYAAAGNASPNLYDDFTAHLQSLTNSNTNTNLPAVDANKCDLDWNAYSTALLERDKKVASQVAPNSPNQNKWLVILNAGGWTTGPNDPKRTR